MKRYNNFLIVGIDHGYGNIKTANTVTPTGITKLDAAPTFTKNTLYYDGSYYLIGEGRCGIEHCDACGSDRVGSLDVPVTVVDTHDQEVVVSFHAIPSI